MIPYAILFAIYAIPALVFQQRASLARTTASGGADFFQDGKLPRSLTFLPIIFALYPILLIGSREWIGADFGVYQIIFEDISVHSLNYALRAIDPGYGLINYFVAAQGWPIWAVNMICAILFMYGLTVFAKAQPNPWLALAASVPYLIIVVGMGYSRQAVAISLAMAGFAKLRKGSLLQFGLFVIAAALFHRSAIILLPFAILSTTRNWLFGGMALIASIGLGYLVLESGQGLGHFNQYLESDRQSSGALVRLLMNALPAVLFLLTSHRFAITENERRMWRNFALVAVLSLLAYSIFPSSTAIDRLALYLIPMQIFVLANMPTTFGETRTPLISMTVFVVAYSAAIEFIWLNTGSNAFAWVPYNSYFW